MKTIIQYINESEEYSRYWAVRPHIYIPNELMVETYEKICSSHQEAISKAKEFISNKPEKYMSWELDKDEYYTVKIYEFEHKYQDSHDRDALVKIETMDASGKISSTKKF